MSASLQEDETAAYEVSHSAGVTGCPRKYVCTPVSPSTLYGAICAHPLHTCIARSDGAERPADQCSCPGADQTEWYSPTEGDGANVPLPLSD